MTFNIEYICPHCGYKMDEEEADSTCDEGCPVCRCIVEWEEEPKDGEL